MGEGDADRPHPPPPPCFDALDACAKSTEEIATCVDGALACFASLHKGPPPPPPGGGEGEGEGAPEPPR